MGAIGIAEITREYMKSEDSSTKFRGGAILSSDYSTKITQCQGCENNCELLSLYADGKLLACPAWSGCNTAGQ